jgi:hypothetical protein
MAIVRTLRRTAPRRSGAHFAHGFRARFVLVGGATAFVMGLFLVLTSGPEPNWIGLVAVTGAVSLFLGVLAGLFGERFVDWWLWFLKNISP